MPAVLWDKDAKDAAAGRPAENWRPKDNATAVGQPAGAALTACPGVLRG